MSHKQVMTLPSFSMHQVTMGTALQRWPYIACVADCTCTTLGTRS